MGFRPRTARAGEHVIVRCGDLVGEAIERRGRGGNVAGQGREAVQIERGKLRASINGLPIVIATFNLGVRSCGEFSKERVAIGMLVASTGRVTRSGTACSAKSNPN